MKNFINQNDLPEFEAVSKLLRLDESNGRLFRTVTIGSNGRSVAGSEAGCRMSSGYRYVSLFGKRIPAHRIVWLLHTGKWPEMYIDHINGIKDDNRPINLRDVSMSHNIQNQKAPHKNNRSSSTVPGCYWSPSASKWIAACRIKGHKQMKKAFNEKIDAEKCVIEYRRMNMPTNTI